MKPLHLASAFYLAALTLCPAEEPSLTVYQKLPEGSYVSGAELILKVRNPPGRTYYVLVLTMSDVPYVIEIQKNGEWVPAPRPHPLSDARLRPFLPDSYLLLGIPVPLERDDTVFRVRVFLYTSSYLEGIFPGSTTNSVVEIVSGSFSTKDIRSPTPAAYAPPPVPKAASK